MNVTHSLKRLFLRYIFAILLGLFYIVVLNICKYDGKARLSKSFMSRCTRSLMRLEHIKEYFADYINNDKVHEPIVHLMDDPLKLIMYDNYVSLTNYGYSEDTYLDDELNKLSYDENVETSKGEYDELPNLDVLTDNLNEKNNMKSKMDEAQIHDMGKLTEKSIDYYNDRKKADSKLIYVGKDLRHLLFENYKDVSNNVDKLLIKKESNDNISKKINEEETNRFNDVIILKEEEKPLFRDTSNKAVQNDLYEKNKKYKKESEDIELFIEDDFNELLNNILHLQLHAENNYNWQHILREYTNDTVQGEVKTIFGDDSFRKDEDDDKINISYIEKYILEDENVKKILDDILSYKKMEDINKLINYFRKYSGVPDKLIVKCAHYLLHHLNMEADEKSLDVLIEELIQYDENNIFKKNEKFIKYITNERVKKEYELDFNIEKNDKKMNVFSNEKDFSINKDISSLKSYNICVKKCSDLWLRMMKNERGKFNHIITDLYRIYRTLIKKYKVASNFAFNEWSEINSNIELYMKNTNIYLNIIFNEWINNNRLNIGEFKILVMFSRFLWRKFKKDIYDSNKKYITNKFQDILDEENRKKK
ncbi:Plasmodium exported protein (PHISTb), unknown function [Plasmodium reichenowi]|uniref:Plasmodium RESA N-terminal domain-containing protein n=1 Tax=Plasmodium reichenowi TaxID=5854 RepID=A0A2P9DHG3_PLARE|nr:Plasmodium exported protein (PHISTb), unknown function [Plasmodium reichenowi]